MNKIFCDDNLKTLKKLEKDNIKIDLIYIDPPFNSDRNYLLSNKAQTLAFTDTWSNFDYTETLEEIKVLGLGSVHSYLKVIEKHCPFSYVSYLSTMAHRIYYMRKVLKDTGSFYIHIDPTMSHYLKIICDMIFGISNFRNEIVWCYKTGGSSKQYFSKKHDTILFYSKSENYTFNTIKEKSYLTGKFGFKDSQHLLGKDEKGYYTMVNCRDYWVLDALGRSSSERLGYPTQKPEALLERIIKASSNEGDLVADFFCGCGTSVAVAHKLGRRFLGVDISHLAVKLVSSRLQDHLKQLS